MAWGYVGNFGEEISHALASLGQASLSLQGIPTQLPAMGGSILCYTPFSTKHKMGTDLTNGRRTGMRNRNTAIGPSLTITRREEKSEEKCKSS